MPPPMFAAGSLFICRDPNPAPGSDPLDNVYFLLAKQENSDVLVSFSGKIDAPPAGVKRRARSPLTPIPRWAALQRYMARCIGVDQSPAPEEYDYSNTFAAVREGYEESKGVCGTCSLEDLVTYVGQRQPLSTFRDDRVCMQPIFLGDLTAAQRADLEGRFQAAPGFHSCMYEIESVHFCSLAAVLNDAPLGAARPVRLPFRVKANVLRCLTSELLRKLPETLWPSRNGLPPLAAISGGFREWLNGTLPHPARATVEEAIIVHRRGVVARAERAVHPTHQLDACGYCGGLSSSGNCCHVSAPPMLPVFSPLHAPLLFGFERCDDHPTVVVPSFFGVIASLPSGKVPRQVAGAILPLAPALAPHLLTVRDLLTHMGHATDATASSPASRTDSAAVLRKFSRIAYAPGAHHAPSQDAPCQGMLVRFIVLRGSRKVSDRAQIVEWGAADRVLVGAGGAHHIGRCLAAWAALSARSVRTQELADALASELTA